MKRTSVIASLLALLFAGPGIVFSQASGTIGGTVRDSSAAVVPAAKVTATNEGTNLTRSVLTDTGGEYVAGVRVH